MAQIATARVTRRGPSRSISTPPWIDNSSGNDATFTITVREAPVSGDFTGLLNDISLAAKIVSRRGEIICRVETKGRNKMPEGMVFVPFFDAGRLVNKLILDATDPGWLGGTLLATQEEQILRFDFEAKTAGQIYRVRVNFTDGTFLDLFLEL